MWNYIKIMDTNKIISVISSLRNLANEFLIGELKKEGVSNIAPSHGHILNALFENDGISMKEITEKINKKKNTVTVLIEKLTAQGFVRKGIDCSDKRTTLVFLTHKGKTLEKSFKDISTKLIDKAYNGFTEKEKSNLMMFLKRMETNFE